MATFGFSTQQGKPGSALAGISGGTFPQSATPPINPGDISIGGNTIGGDGATSVDKFSAQQLFSIADKLGKLVARLAPAKVYQQQRFNKLVFGEQVRVNISGLTFNGFGYSLISGTAYIYFAEEVLTAPDGTPIDLPDVIFVGGTSSGYFPLPADMPADLIIVSADSGNLLTGTITLESY